eukprot:86085-Prymnesium_polylepis.1
MGRDGTCYVRGFAGTPSEHGATRLRGIAPAGHGGAHQSACVFVRRDDDRYDGGQVCGRKLVVCAPLVHVRRVSLSGGCVRVTIDHVTRVTDSNGGAWTPEAAMSAGSVT